MGQNKLKANKQIMKNNNLSKINFKLETIYKLHNDWIKSISLFPSGKIISVSSDKSINIYNTNFTIFQKINEAHEKNIINLSIKDENNFATCSFNDIKTWIKKDNKYILNKNISNAHEKWINKIIFFQNGNLISCSRDNTVKIWEENINNYQLITTIQNLKYIMSILFLNHFNLLLTCGFEGTKIWNLFDFGKYINFKYYFNEVICSCWNGIDIFDNDKIIIGGNKYLFIISILDMKIIKKIDILFRCNGIKVFYNKGFLLFGGWSYDIIIYNCYNLKIINKIENAHNGFINGFINLNNNLIGSFSADNNLKIWSFK